MSTAVATPALIHDGFTYSAEDHTRYEREGYHWFKQFLSPAGLQHCRTQTDGMLARLQKGRATEEIYSAHQIEPWLWELGTQPRLLDMIERQIGPNIILWSSHLLCKAPRTGKLVPWHQDAPYWNIKGNYAGAVWIALDDIDRDNGAMAILPGWHAKGTLKIRQRDATFFNDEIDPQALPADIEQQKVEYRLPAGAMATHHTMMPHNSPPNVSDRWRRVIVFRYVAAGAELGGKMYPDYRTGTQFPRRFFLVRGQDIKQQGLERSPF